MEDGRVLPPPLRLLRLCLRDLRALGILRDRASRKSPLRTEDYPLRFWSSPKVRRPRAQSTRVLPWLRPLRKPRPGQTHDCRQDREISQALAGGSLDQPARRLRASKGRAPAPLPSLRQGKTRAGIRAEIEHPVPPLRRRHLARVRFMKAAFPRLFSLCF